MLKLSNIKKDYVTGDSVVHALKGVSLEFRKSEFVSILGQSGCGKTTLLNIIGGLDQYTSGDLIINGKSTKEYGDREWDTYRNHSVGFVFQSYNLIPHQTVLANVELALTLSGISKDERRTRAIEALETVGLGEQIKKRPNQLSGGQMQRVAIARALVNNPDILLADEPTGALDSETSVQIMELLKAISNDKLIIMVTHNPDLAKEYSTRIINLLDGEVVNDSNPYVASADEQTLVKISASAYKRGSLRELEAKKLEHKAILSGLKGQDREKYLAKKTEFTEYIKSKTQEINQRYKELAAEEKAAKASAKEQKRQMMAEINALPTDQKEARLAELKAKKAEEKKAIKEKRLAEKKTSMSFLTALSLSKNNLMTKKGRTFLTAFAGSIGIIGIALILSVSSGVSAYITSIEEGTMSSYPLEIKESSMDVMTLLGALMDEGGVENPEPGNVYSHDVLANMFVSANKGLTSNNLVAFKSFLDENSVILDNITDIKYSYTANLNTYIPSGESYKATLDGIGGILSEISSGSSSLGSIGGTTSSLMGGNVFKELIGDEKYIKSQYDIVHGRLPEKSNEVILVVDKHNQISDMVLYSLGLKEIDDLKQYVADIYMNKESTPPEAQTFTFEELCNYTFKVLPEAEKYKVDNGQIIPRTPSEIDAYLNNAMTLEIVGIVTPSENASGSSVMGAIGYTSDLMQDIMKSSNASKVVEAQQNNKTQDLFTGLPYTPDLPDLTTVRSSLQIALGQYGVDISSDKYEDDRSLIDLLKQFLSTDPTFTAMLSFKSSGSMGMAPWGGYTIEDYGLIEATLNSITDPTVGAMAKGIKMACLANGGPENFIKLVNSLLYEDLTISAEDAHANTMNSIGFVDYSKPKSISIYPKDFESKQAIKDEITNYNNTRTNEADKIAYSDTVALLMSSITTIVDAITYVLVAFVAISLIVSSIMIGIITYISVLERTKEIGILRAIGASKKDISRVFNAETLIVGFAAGVIGILVSLFFILIINIILLSLTGLETLQAVLPVGAAVILVLISMGLTLVAGLFPAKVAAKKDPVIALRTE